MLTRLCVIGDAFQDVWLTARANRRSAEAAIDIYDITTKRVQPGGAHNVVRAISLLDPDTVILKWFTGSDFEMPIKTRIVVNGQQVCRFDMHDQCFKFKITDGNYIKDKVVVISDYNKGSIDNAQVEKIAAANPRTIWVNSKLPESNLECLDMAGQSGSRIATDVRWTCNEDEYKASKDFYDRQTCVYITKGANGIEKRTGSATQKCFSASHPSVANYVNSVCGAGDVVVAALAVCPEGYNELLWAMCAAAEAVEKPFTGGAERSAVIARYHDNCK